MSLIKNHFLTGITLVILFISSCKEKKENTTESQKQITTDYLNETQATFDQRMNWWREAKFGMFIHWGVYAVPAGTYKGKQIEGIGEWIMSYGDIPTEDYEQFAKQFNPEKFDAETWAKAMKQAGIKYVVITSKHHDGFGLWDSKVSDYDIVDFAPYGKDILKALSEACKKQGIKFGLYYSIMDGHHPDAQLVTNSEDIDWHKPVENKNFNHYLEDYMKPQLKELIMAYDPEIIWFDGEWIPNYTHEQGQALYQYVRSLKENILINNRVDKGRQGMQGMNKQDQSYAGDFGTPEQEILDTSSDLDWESCMTMNDTWGFKSYDHNWKSTETLIHNLIDTAAKGGNYLLNVGPTAEGLIPQPSIERLEAIGNWLSVNGEAIYTTEKLKSTFGEGEHIRYTKKKGESVYYAISLKVPSKNIVFKHVRPKKESKIYLLGNETALEWMYSESESLQIKIPKSLNKETKAWVFKIEGEEIL